MRTTVINIKNAPVDWQFNSKYVFIGRPGKWGNRFKIGVDGNRADVIRKHKESLTIMDKKEIKQKLAGKILVCFCKPLDCHGDTLAEIANE
jgi:hypothetical protein